MRGYLSRLLVFGILPILSCAALSARGDDYPNGFIVKKDCGGDPMCIQENPKSSPPARKVQHPAAQAAPSKKREPVHADPAPIAPAPQARSTSGHKKTHIPDFASMAGGEGDEDSDIGQTRDASGNWTYDFSKGDKISGAANFCAMIRERPLGIHIPIPCFDQYMSIYENSWPDPAQARQAYAQALRCSDSCVTEKDARFLAGCQDFLSADDAAHAEDFVDNLFAKRPGGSIGHCSAEQIHAAIMKNEYSDTHRTEDGKCTKPNFAQFQFGLWEDPVVLVANSKTFMEKDSRFLTCDGPKNDSPAEVFRWGQQKLRDYYSRYGRMPYDIQQYLLGASGPGSCGTSAKAYVAQEREWLKQIIEGFRVRSAKFPADTKMILLNQDPKDPRVELDVHDPDLVSKAMEVIDRWHKNTCEPNCVDLAAATLGKLPEYQNRLKAGQKLFDANQLKDFTLPCINLDPQCDSVAKRLLTQRLYTVDTPAAAAVTEQWVDKHAKKQAPMILPPTLDLSQVEVEMDGQVLPGDAYSIDPKTRELTIKAAPDSIELHLVNIHYKDQSQTSGKQ